MISKRLNQIQESLTFKITAEAKAMKNQGIDIIDLSVGEPDFPTPENIKKAGIKAIEDNFTKYTQSDGIPELKEAIINKFQYDNGLTYSKDEILISSGAKNSLYNFIHTIINEGDEVIVPSPYWVTYPQVVCLAGAKAIIASTNIEDGFILKPEQLKSVISPKTKAIILNNPTNPTGAAYQKNELEPLAEIILENDIYVLSDEIYEKLVYDDFKFFSFASLGKEIKKKTVTINGVSKSFAMTGWRIGYAAGPRNIIKGMAKIQSHSTSNACSISQKASVEALNGPKNKVSEMASEFQRRRNYMLKRLETIPAISFSKPKGAFYIFPDCSFYYKKEFNNTPIQNSYNLAYYLLKEAKVAVVPGEAFGADAFLRISYATSMENLEKGMDRIIEALSKLKTT
ncbi:MAG: pyridoxal phosphate-dependent aminotransferase [Candidatus Aminicenantaceae bacterium]